MICPACASDVSLTATVRALTSCPACLRTLALEDGGVRLATGDDTRALDPDEVKALQQARKKLRAKRG